MSSDGPIPIPEGNAFQWAMANPDALIQAIRLLNLISGLQIQVTPFNTSPGAKPTLLISENNCILPIPIQVLNSYGMPVGTLNRASFDTATVTLPQLAGAVAALIRDLQATGQVPTS